MQAALIYYNDRLAGRLSKGEGIYRFVYDKDYLSQPASPPDTPAKGSSV